MEDLVHKPVSRDDRYSGGITTEKTQRTLPSSCRRIDSGALPRAVQEKQLSRWEQG